MEIFTFALRKGGTGKSTSAWAVGHCLAHAGHRVLLVDADSQANLTRCLPAVATEKSLTQVIDNKATLLDVMQPVANNLWLVAANESLVVAEKGLGADLAYPLLFKKAIKNLAAHIDYILIDSPPSPNSPLTIAALAASTKVYVPAQPELFSFDGVNSLLELVAKIQDSYNPELEMGGIFLTKYAATYRKSLHHQFVKRMRDQFGPLVMQATIRDNVAIPEAQVQRRSLHETAPSSNALADYEALTQEIIA